MPGQNALVSTLIDLDDTTQVEYWANELDVDFNQICLAVKQVGPNVEDVVRHFGQAPSPLA